MNRKTYIRGLLLGLVGIIAILSFISIYSVAILLFVANPSKSIPIAYAVVSLLVVSTMTMRLLINNSYKDNTSGVAWTENELSAHKARLLAVAAVTGFLIFFVCVVSYSIYSDVTDERKRNASSNTYIP